MQDNRKFAIYSRKSKFTGKGESIGNQIELCKQNIHLSYPDISDDDILIFEDEGFSGGNTKRPQFQKMLKQCREKKIKCIVCYRLDRISRNVSDYSSLIEELNNLNVSFVSINEKFDTSTSMGRAMMYIASVFAQLERETIAERIRDNMLELAKDGRWLGGNPPTGYKSVETIGSVTVDGKKRKAHMLEIVPEESEIVKLIFQKFLEFHSLTKTETYLIQHDCFSKNNKPLSRFTIKAILSNPVYLIADEQAWNYFETKNVDIFSEKSEFNGEHAIMAYNKTKQKIGKSNEIRDIKDWIIAVGKHKGIINSHDWIEVQKLLDQNKSKSYRKPKSNVALLSGILFCGKCGSFMRPKLSQRKNKDGELIYDYLCELKEKSKSQKCDMKRPNGNELDRIICEEIKKLSEDESEFMTMIKKEQKTFSNHNVSYKEKLKSLKKLKSDNEAKIKGLVHSLSEFNDTVAHEYIFKEINELDKKIKSLQEQIQEYENLTETETISNQEFENLAEILLTFAKSFDNMNVEQKRSAIRAFVRRIIWDGDNIHIYFFGSEDSEIDLSNDEISEAAEIVLKMKYSHNGYYQTSCFKILSFLNDWKIYNRINDKFYILYCNKDGDIIYSPLYIYSFRFITERCLLKSQIFLSKNPDPQKLESVSDKLKWYRTNKGLRQCEVAESIGVNRTTYARYEENDIETYPLGKLDKIAKLFQVDITNLLDDYHLFLYNGQGQQIKKLRKSFRLTQSEFAKYINIPLSTLKNLEQNKNNISKKLFKQIIGLL